MGQLRGREALRGRSVHLFERGGPKALPGTGIGDLCAESQKKSLGVVIVLVPPLAGCVGVTKLLLNAWPLEIEPSLDSCRPHRLVNRRPGRLNDLHNLVGEIPQEIAEDKDTGRARCILAFAKIVADPVEVFPDKQDSVPVYRPKATFSGVIVHDRQVINGACPGSPYPRVLEIAHNRE
jgi:hypothetical protein